MFDNLNDVETSVEYLDRQQKTVHLIRGIIRTFNMISLHIAIESSRSGSCADEFDHFVDEIKEL